MSRPERSGDRAREFDSIIRHAQSALDEGVVKRTHPYHLMTVACVNEVGGPEVRTVVLRRHDADNRSLSFHTDIRSPKVRWMKQNPQVTLLFYDPQEKIQLRLYARASVHYQDEIARRQWQRTKNYSKICYLAPHGSGSEVDGPEDCGVSSEANKVDSPEKDEAAYCNFAVIECQYDTLDYVYLKLTGHQRARLQWHAAGDFDGRWLAV